VIWDSLCIGIAEEVTDDVGWEALQ
jgi:hypothetical protein